jgi:ferric-dicitrate binding protein FerR (iron transport regulator)
MLNRFLQGGGISGQEEKNLFEWFSTSDTKDKLFLLYQDHLEKASDWLDNDIQQRMFEHIGLKIKEIDQARKIRKLSFRYRVAQVAAACILFCFGLSFYFLQGGQQVSSGELIIKVDRGQKASMELPDGTLVWLNSDTKMNYSNTYNHKDRIVKLDGEAYFEVVKDPDKPFVVQVNDMEIEALGTAFNVKAYATDDHIYATLMEGKVVVITGDDRTLLSPNEHLSYSCNTHESVKTTLYNTDLVSAWQKGRVVFSGETLGEAAVMLERIYNIRIIFETEDIKGYTLLGTIKNNSLSNVFEIMSLTVPITYTITDNSIIICKNSNRIK